MRTQFNDSDDPEYKDVMENLLNDRPSLLELQVQTSRVYTEIAATEYKLHHFVAAHDAQQTAAQAYRKALELLPISGDTEMQDRLEQIRLAIDQNQNEFGL